MGQWGCVLATEDYTVWTNWWSLATAFTYLIGGFFPRLVFGGVVSPAGNVHIKTVLGCFSRGQAQFETPPHHIYINLQSGEG